jgi:hypothetical protein
VSTLSVSFCAPPHVDHVERVAKFVAELCRTYISDEDALARLQLAAYELMENVVKYTSQGDGTFRLELSQGSEGCRVVLETENAADGTHRSELEARMTRLSSAHDPLSHYDSEIAASARRPLGSGLGLVRIRAEGEMVMDHTIEGEKVVVRVEAAILAEQHP